MALPEIERARDLSEAGEMLREALDAGKAAALVADAGVDALLEDRLLELGYDLRNEYKDGLVYLLRPLDKGYSLMMADELHETATREFATRERAAEWLFAERGVLTLVACTPAG